MGLRDDAERAERQRVAGTAAREAAEKEERERPSDIHPKLLEFAKFCTDEQFKPITFYRLVHSTERVGKQSWKETYARETSGWVTNGAWNDQIAVDESGRTWDVKIVDQSGFWDASFRTTRGLPRRPKWSWVIGQARHITAEQAQDWALRGASGVLGGRAKDGVVEKSPEELAREHDVNMTNR